MSYLLIQANAEALLDLTYDSDIKMTVKVISPQPGGDPSSKLVLEIVPAEGEIIYDSQSIGLGVSLAANTFEGTDCASCDGEF